MLEFLKKYSPSRIGSGKNIRLFQNPILEKLTYVHPAMPIALWVPILSAFFIYELRTGNLNISSALYLAVFGLCFWTLAEYLLHRFVFHFKPSSNFGKRIAFLIHGIHHDDPEDARRLLMPPLASIVIAAVLYAIFSTLLGFVLVKPFFSGFLVGYLIYDYIHFSVHFIQPKSMLMKSLKQNHMLHHYATPNMRYGVSNTFWDYVFATRPELKQRAKT